MTRRIAGHDQQVANAHRLRAEQVRLHAEQVPVAAGVVEDRLDARPAATSTAVDERAHPAAGARTVGNVDEVDAADAQLAGRVDELVGAMAARRQQLDG